jgi:hypothetical protein
MAKEFGKIEDSGERRGFDTGAKRDVDDDKPRFDLIPVTVLQRVVQYYDNFDLSDIISKEVPDRLKARMLNLGFLWGATAHDDILLELIWICLKIIELQENDTVLSVNPKMFNAFHIISPKTYLRIANHYGGGAKKYDPWNWSKGMPHSVFHASLMRHIFKIMDDATNEDHWSAIFFNAAAILHFKMVGRDDMDDITPRLVEWGDYASC